LPARLEDLPGALLVDSVADLRQTSVVTGDRCSSLAAIGPKRSVWRGRQLTCMSCIEDPQAWDGSLTAQTQRHMSPNQTYVWIKPYHTRPYTGK
jgi:hypothetical protein